MLDALVQLTEFVRKETESIMSFENEHWLISQENWVLLLALSYLCDLINFFISGPQLLYI